MFPVILFMIVLVGVLSAFFLFVVLEIFRHYLPYSLFKIHAKLVTKGLYRVERKDDYFKIKSLFVTARVWESTYSKGKIEFHLDTGFNTLFNVYYLQQEKTIKDFTCSEKFAKGVNNDNFVQLLGSYIPYVLEREFGKKSDRVLAQEKMQHVSETFALHAKKEKQKEDNYQLTTLQTTSYELTKLVENINQRAAELYPHKYELELEEQHQFETLLNKRVPNALKHAEQYEKEVKEMLQDVLHKIEQWQFSIQETSTNDFEKELLLIKKITQH